MSFVVSQFYWDEVDGYKPNKKIILAALAAWANDNGEAHPSIARLAKRAGMTTTALKNNLAQLENEGAISIFSSAGFDTNKGTTNLFTLNAYRASIGLPITTTTHYKRTVNTRPMPIISPSDGNADDPQRGNTSDPFAGDNTNEPHNTGDPHADDNTSEPHNTGDPLDSNTGDPVEGNASDPIKSVFKSRGKSDSITVFAHANTDDLGSNHSSTGEKFNAAHAAEEHIATIADLPEPEGEVVPPPDDAEQDTPALNDYDAAILAVKTAWKTGDQFARVIEPQLRGRAAKGKRKEWNIEPSLTPQQIIGFGLWWHDKYPDIEIPTAAETIYERISEFLGAYNYDTVMMHANKKFDELAGIRPGDPEEELFDVSADMDAFYDQLGLDKTKAPGYAKRKQAQAAAQ